MRSRGMAQLISYVIYRLRMSSYGRMPISVFLGASDGIFMCWRGGSFGCVSTRCSRPLASTGSLGLSQLISCVFRRLRVSCGGKTVIRVLGRGASRVVDEWNSKTVTRPWQGVRRSARYPATASTRKRGRFEETQEAPLRPTSEGCCAYSTLPLKRPRQRRGSRRSCSSLSRNQSPGPNGSQEEAKAHSDQS